MSITSNRQSPNNNASNYKLGVKKTGIDGNQWKVVEDVNGRHLWVMARNKTYIYRPKSKGKKTKSKLSRATSKSKTKTKSKAKSKGDRKGPKESATLYKIGTKKIGIDGNKWIIVENSKDIKRWKLYKKIQL